MEIYPVRGTMQAHWQAAEAFRHKLHQHPELTWQEHATADSIRAALSALDIPWRACAGTGTIARLNPAGANRANETAGTAGGADEAAAATGVDAGDGAAGPDSAVGSASTATSAARQPAAHAPAANTRRPHIALRADIDALPIHEETNVPWKSRIPGCMHACGHDGHTAALMLTASWLKQHESQLPGPITLLFQPAEEGGHGAKKMIEDGALEGIDEIYGWHNWPAIPFGKAVCPIGPVMSANATFSIDIQGMGGHSSQPELCRDPVLSGSAVVTALQQIVSRRLPPQIPAVVSITSFDAPSAPTVIRDTIRLEGSIRVADTALLTVVTDLITEIAVNTAAAYGTIATVEHIPRYGATINHPKQAQRAGAALQTVLGTEYHHPEIMIPLMASEDFSYYLEEIPGAFMLIGSAVNNRYSAACHSPRYEFNDALIETAARTMILLTGGPLPSIDHEQTEIHRNSP
ncbi:MAG: amidohydrolase [Spirochaeta sp.]